MNTAKLEQRMRAMLETIDRHFYETAACTGYDAMPTAVCAAIAATPRHLFVPEADKSQAYRDCPLPIGLGQTISQPFIVALMTTLVRPGPGDRVLEVGTGCGYQAAVLAQLVDSVYTLEIVEPLADAAKKLLASMQLDNVYCSCKNGSAGDAEHAPFDSIIVTAAAADVPDALIQQLRPGGRIVIPVGVPGHGQQLTLLTKSPSGEVGRREVLAVQFVPFTGR